MNNAQTLLSEPWSHFHLEGSNMAMAALMEEPVLAAVLGARKHSPKTDDRVRFIAELVEFSTSPNFHLPIVFSLYFFK